MPNEQIWIVPSKWQCIADHLDFHSDSAFLTIISSSIFNYLLLCRHFMVLYTHKITLQDHLTVLDDKAHVILVESVMQCALLEEPVKKRTLQNHFTSSLPAGSTGELSIPSLIGEIERDACPESSLCRTVYVFPPSTFRVLFYMSTDVIVSSCSDMAVHY